MNLVVYITDGASSRSRTTGGCDRSPYSSPSLRKIRPIPGEKNMRAAVLHHSYCREKTYLCVKTELKLDV